MASMHPERRRVFENALVAVQEAVTNGTTIKTAKDKDRHWRAWLEFCQTYTIDPFLQYEDPIPYLQVFGQLYRDGISSLSGKPVRSTTVSNVLCSVGQTFLRVGERDPRISPHTGAIDFRLARQAAGWTKKDPPPSRVRPAPITLVTFLLDVAHTTPATSPINLAVADIVCLAFFFLLRPGEYTGTTNDDAAFRLEDVRLHLGQRRLDLTLASDVEIKSATWVSLYFTTQKNQRKGDSISLGRTSHPLCCPVQAAIRFVLRHRRHFHRHGQPVQPRTKLAQYYDVNNTSHAIRAEDVTKALRFAATACQHSTGIAPADISARSLRAGGAMALLVGRVDTDTIKLLGRWHSDAMMRYLHQDSIGVMQKLAKLMYNHGRYDFLPEATVPALPPEPTPPALDHASPPRPPPSPPPSPPAPRRSRRLQGNSPLRTRHIPRELLSFLTLP